LPCYSEDDISTLLRKAGELLPVYTASRPRRQVCLIVTALRTSNPTKLTFLIIIIISGVRLSPLGTAATTGLLYQPQMIDDVDCEAIAGMKIRRGNESTRRKPAPVPFCPSQIPHDLTWARTRAAAVGSQRLTT
jgi:hypothetical protein